jgi:hypothetical protein|tara:strand:+ start:5164 stop:5361 length:198 start_codon:yes stop_codon:yes gene_type:complete
MKIKEEKRNKEIIDYVVDLYSSSGKGFNKAKRFLRKKFGMKVSENDLERALENLEVKRFEALNKE